MIAKLTGILESSDSNSIIIDVTGVGYQVYVTSSVFGKLPKVGEKISIYTKQVVREDSQDLYGFLSKEERNLFSIVLSVSGFGPKVSISLLSSFKLEQLVAAITQGNVDLITSVPGVGRKTAQKLVIELKEKVGKAFSVEKSSITKDLPGDSSPLMSDAVSALVTLGYNPKEAKTAVMSSGVDFAKVRSVEEVIKQSLMSLR